MRKRLWQFHSWLGLLAGLGLVVIGLSGSLLMFHEEIETLLNPDVIRVEPTSEGRLPAARLLATVNRELPDHEVAGWLFRQPDEAGLADVIYVRRHGSHEWFFITVDPYRDKILASPRLGTESFTGWMLDLHYTFFADHAGMIVTGALGLALCVLGVTGVWLYREFWKHVFTLRWGRGARLLFSDLHKFVGITSVAFNLILGFTGAYWNITHIIHEMGEDHDDHAPMPARRLYAEPLPIDALIADAATRIDGYLPRYLSLPWEESEQPALTFYGQVPGNVLRGPYGSTVAYDARTHAFTSAYDVRTAGLWANIADAFVPLHYGTFGGLPVKILWTLGGLTPGALAITGFVMWRLRKRRQTPGSAKPGAPGVPQTDA